jgi:hypothetical protein
MDRRPRKDEIGIRQRLTRLWPLPWLIAVLALVALMLNFEIARASAPDLCPTKLLPGIGYDTLCGGSPAGPVTVGLMLLVAAGTMVAIARLIRGALRAT